MLSRCQLAARAISAASSRNALTATRTSRPCASLDGGEPLWKRYSSRASEMSRGSGSSSGSIFTSKDTWDEIFQDKEESDLFSDDILNSKRTSAATRRHTMSERETKVLTGMLDMIFDTPSPGSTGTSKDMPLGVGRGHVDDLFAKLRRHSKPLRWAKDPSSSLLDQKKEAMGRCSTDQELLEWAEREVFEESRRYEEEARRAIAEASAKGGTAELPMLQSPIYAQMIAHLMRTFRVHYNDPNIALFIFHHAQKLSIISYVFGCSTEAYNELIETRWTCFRDLQGVHQAVEEMVVNGVPVDSRTRKIIESMRRDLGTLELRDGSTEDRQQEVLKALTNVEWLVASTAEDTSRRAGHSWDQWKNEVSKDTSLEDWSFDDWESLKSLPSTSTTGRYRGSGRPGRDRRRSRREASMY